MYRRQLTVAQRSIIAAEIVCRDVEGINKSTNQDGAEGDAPHPSHLRPGLGFAQAATLLGISERSVSSAARVARSGVDELLSAVKSGKVKISVAEYIAKLDEDKQRELCAQGAKAIRETARQMREDRRKKDHPQENISLETAAAAPAANRPPMTDTAEALTQFVRFTRRRGGRARDIADQITKEITAADNDDESFFFGLEVASMVRDNLVQKAILETT